MNQRKAIEAALAEMGITNETQLNDAIRNMKPLNLSLMADRKQERKASIKCQDRMYKKYYIKMYS